MGFWDMTVEEALSVADDDEAIDVDPLVVRDALIVLAREVRALREDGRTSS